MRGRLCVLGWCLALVAMAASVMNLDDAVNVGDFLGFGLADNRRWALAIPLAAGLVALWRPRLAALIAPWALVLLGLFGILARQAYLGYSLVFFDEVSYWLARAVGRADYTQLLVMPVAFLSVLLGARKAAQDLTTRPWAAPRLGRLAAPATGGPWWSLLLLPVAATAASLFQPRVVGYGSSMVMFIWLAGSLPAALLIIRKSPGLAACLGALAVVTFGLAGLRLQRVWVPGGWFPAGHWYSVHSSAVQAAAFIGLGCWLAARVWPQARSLLSQLAGAGPSGQLQQLTQSRSVAVDPATADLRPMGRNLRDDAQARLIALGMSLRAAERLIPASPDAAVALVAEARETSATALTELRELALGAPPPVLADRSLADVVRDLALDSPLRVETDIDLPGRIPATVETACYFAVAEVLSNAAKHSGAREAQICMSHSGGMLRIEVTDFGLGGADPAGGSGLVCIERRLAALDGILAISSPTGGPTIVVIEVPCMPSSPRTFSD
jgi:signal transduction histidine kinase